MYIDVAPFDGLRRRWGWISFQSASEQLLGGRLRKISCTFPRLGSRDRPVATKNPGGGRGKSHRAAVGCFCETFLRGLGRGFTGTLGWSYREGIEDALQLVQFASKIGAKLVIIHSGGRGLHTFNHSRRIFREALKEIGPAAAEAGVQLALEPCHPAASEQLDIH